MGSGFSTVSASILPPGCILELCDVICLLMCSEYPLQLLNGSRCISPRSCSACSKLWSLVVSRSSPCCSFFLLCSVFPSPSFLFLGLPPVALVPNSSPADPASPALYFCTLISLSAFALRDKSLHTHTQQVRGVSTGCGFNERQLNESTLLSMAAALQCLSGCHWDVRLLSIMFGSFAQNWQWSGID